MPIDHAKFYPLLDAHLEALNLVRAALRENALDPTERQALQIIRTANLGVLRQLLSLIHPPVAAGVQ